MSPNLIITEDLIQAVQQAVKEANSEDDLRVGLERALSTTLRASGLTTVPEDEKTALSSSAGAGYGHKAIEYKTLVMAGPMRWVVLTTGGKVTTLAWFVKVRYTAQGSGSVLFARSDLRGHGSDDVFAVFSDNLTMAEHLRDDIFSYTAFAGVPGQTPPAPIVKATFESQGEFPARIVESMRAVDGTTLTLSLGSFGPPKAYVRAVNERLTEVGAFVIPAEFSLEINGIVPVGRPEAGPLAEAPPVGVDLQNLWYHS